MPATETKVNIQPLDDRIVLEVVEDENQQTAGGIYLPDTARDKPQTGMVLAVGPGRMDDKGQRIAMQLKVGNKVLFGKYSGTDVKISGKEVKIMSEKDVLGIVD
ncbi:MAG: co-chaperone GroES [Cyanobacteria bacterium P01_H01_bin.74]